MKIVLIGYMGSGKSSVGKHLSNILDIPFRDLDDEIEKAEQSSIKEIFTKRGEIYFRKLENQTLKALLCSQGNFVLATGGGTPCYANSLALMLNAKDTLTIYLKTPLKILCSRLMPEKDRRPLLAHLDNDEQMMEFIGIHLFERSHFYNQAGIILETANKSPEEIGDEIAQSITLE